MKTQSLIQKKDEFLKDHQFKIGGLLILTLVTVVLFLLRKHKRDRLNQWLHSMEYTEIDYKTQKIMFPKIIISKNRIVVKNSNLIHHKEVEESREAWEKFFRVKILEISDENGKTILDISK